MEGQTANISATIYVAPPTVWEGQKLDYAVEVKEIHTNNANTTNMNANKQVGHKISPG